ncbi:hypothetical protein [Roseicitreum antarcticum]|uniref:hypothetical protein n=1 Tax=Roseicitreum antarcticum TaxID=564137 RepID=UPI001681B35B|nr:hypothetical protein [Roseicitreum antarcticum]
MIYRKYEFPIVDQTAKVWFVEIPGRQKTALHDEMIPKSVNVMLGLVSRKLPTGLIETHIQLAVPENIADAAYADQPRGPVVDPHEIEKAKEYGNDIHHPGCRRPA